MRKKLIIVVVLTSLAVAGMSFVKQLAAAEPDPAPNILPAETMKVLDSGERFVLFSLDPTPQVHHPKSDPPPKETFHGYPVLGKTEILDPKQRAELLGALYKGISENKGLVVAACFNPRHGISATMAGKTNDLLICFECMQIVAFEKNGKYVYTSDSPLPTFNRALEKAGLPVAKDK